MSDKEKLIELLEEAQWNCYHTSCRKCTYAKSEYRCEHEQAADHFISNGVTVQKWIPVSERLPEKSGYYLVVTAKGSIVDLPYSSRWQAFNAFDGCDNEFAIIVTHWMPLPEPPKECE